MYRGQLAHNKTGGHGPLIQTQADNLLSDEQFTQADNLLSEAAGKGTSPRPTRERCPTILTNVCRKEGVGP